MPPSDRPDAPLHAGPVAVPPMVADSLIREISNLIAPEEKQQPMASENFDADVIVIGAGPGGYVSAIRCAQLGASVIVVEKEFLGGTCLNWGCIPSKAMIAGAERIHAIQTADDMGIKVDKKPDVDFDVFMKRVQKIVQTQRGGIGMLFKKNKVKHVEGFAKFVDKHTIEVEKDGKTQKLRGKNFILAMGASAVRLPINGLEGGRQDGVWTSDDAVTAPHVPKKMLILGGGAVGCEFSYVFSGLGTEVTLVELMPELLPMFDKELGKELQKQLKRYGVNVVTEASLEKVKKVKGGWKCSVKKGSKTEEIEVDVVLLGVGRKANTDGMNLEKIGVKLHKRGIEVKDDTLVTHVDNIYAIGDVTGRIQLAHTASAEGVAVASNIVEGAKKTVDYATNPNAVYTIPEVSSVGLTEEQAKEKGYDVVIGKASFRINGKAMAIGEQDGFVKVVAEKKYGQILGVHMIGPHVTDLIHEAVVAIQLEATLESMSEAIHAHPTLSEIVMEAFHDAAGHAIHKM